MCVNHWTDWRIVNLKIHVLTYVFEEDISIIVYSVEILEFESLAHTEEKQFLFRSFFNSG